MTTLKRDLTLPARPRSYMSREEGAAELGISPDTWDRWVGDGRLPKPAPGFPESTPRWRWVDVDRKLAGKVDNDADAFVSAAANFRRGTKKAPERETA